MDSEKIKAINVLIGGLFFAVEEMPKDPQMQPVFESREESEREVKVRLMTTFLHALHVLGVSEADLAEAMIHAPYLNLGLEELIKLDDIRSRRN